MVPDSSLETTRLQVGSEVFIASNQYEGWWRCKSDLVVPIICYPVGCRLHRLRPVQACRSMVAPTSSQMSDQTCRHRLAHGSVEIGVD